MLPQHLKAGDFTNYPAQARDLAVANLAVLQRLPLCFVPGMLREVIEYDYRFPAERMAIQQELSMLSALPADAFEERLRAFRKIALSSKLESFDWVNHPAQFLEQESAYLWSTQQMDAFRQAATDYGDKLAAAAPAKPLPMRRLGIAVIGQGVTSYDGVLFRKLRERGTFFPKVSPDGGLEQLLAVVASRAAVHKDPYGHWYVDGGQAAANPDAVTVVSYDLLKPVRAALLKRMQAEIDRPGMGPEELRTNMAKLLPQELGMDPQADAVLARFQVKVLTEGSGTQIFATTFAQWTAREILRRAQPLTLLVRYAPRQRQRPMNEMIGATKDSEDVDPAGSLIDGDMGAWYQWLSQQRLPGAEQSVFMAWFEGHNQAVVVAPSMPHGAQSGSAKTLAELAQIALA